MKIYILIENKRKSDSAFLAEHGLSFYFEHNGKRILFDTGASGAFIYNATLHGIDLSKVDICILSHMHYDHTGGLSHFLSINSKAKVYMKRSAADAYYTKRLFGYRYAGIEEGFFNKYGSRVTFVDEDTELTDGLHLVNIDKYRHYPQYTSLMYKKTDEGFVRDDLSHELFITVKTQGGTVVLTGCSHHGLVNILQTAQNKFGDIYGVIGGFHLNGTKRLGMRVKKESAHEIRVIARHLKRGNVKKIYTGHCTGEKPLEKLQMISRTKEFYSGDVIEV